MAGNEDKGPRRGILAWLVQQPLVDRAIRLLSASVLYSALDERLELKEAVQKALRKPVPPYGFRQTFCLGGMAMICFVNQVVTGVLLAIYYQPSAEGAYDSVQYIMNEVSFGWLLRQLHSWGAHLMMIFVLLHMVKVFWTKAYRPPRELTWMTGSCLFFLTMTFCFSGYLLPWDQLSYWGTTVGSEMVRAVPLVGEQVLHIIRGGPTVTGATLSRFFTLHTVVLPWAVIGLLAGHAVLIRRLGISKPL